jgi:hypothetical protein
MDINKKKILNNIELPRSENENQETNVHKQWLICRTGKNAYRMHDKNMMPPSYPVVLFSIERNGKLSGRSSRKPQSILMTSIAKRCIIFETDEKIDFFYYLKNITI